MNRRPVAAADIPDAATAPRDLLTADDVAALLRMTPAWVYEQTRRNRIPHLRLGRYVRYRREALELWMREVEGSATAPSGPSHRPAPTARG
jgi:excisionase family DNA binding protein